MQKRWEQHEIVLDHFGANLLAISHWLCPTFPMHIRKDVFFELLPVWLENKKNSAVGHRREMFLHFWRISYNNQ
jgi:hypothetical protein